MCTNKTNKINIKFVKLHNSDYKIADIANEKMAVVATVTNS